jgi:chaperonin GroEL
MLSLRNGFREGRRMPGSFRAGESLRVEFGYASADFLDPGNATSVRHERPWVVILACPEADVRAILHLLEAIAATGRPAAFFCSDIDAELRATLIVNNTHRTLRSVVIDAPSAADYDRAQLFAVAAATGARIIASPQVLLRTTLQMLGEADSVVVDALSTTLSGFPLQRQAAK